MIETDEQRRWWFATHPEYSWGNKGGKNPEERQDEGDDDKVRPEDVDAYVDNALKYVDGPVADLLKSVKRNFGTEADLLKQWQNALEAWANGEEKIRASLAQYAVDGGAFMPRLPTTEELFRWPRQMTSEFFRWLDAVLQNNPLIIDPNALERHHGLPKKFVKYFLDCGLKIEDFIIIMRVADHRLKPDGLHTGEGRGGDWLREWEEFIDQYPAENTLEHQERIEKKLKEMIKKYRINRKAVLMPERLKRR